MTLVWHILRKDFRHTWIYAAAAAILLLLFAGNFWRVLRVGGRWIDGLFLFQTQHMVELFLVSAWVLLCGVLLHAEALPGPRPYWLTRPIRWQHLLRAKFLLLLAVVVVPVALAHSWLVVSRGFPLFENLGEIAWNALLLGVVCMLPVAIVASITRNLQQLILWILAIAAGALTLQQMVLGFPDHLRWGPNTVTVVIGIAAGTAILLWQYATRRTRAGRIVVIAYFLVLATIDYWPVQIWYAAQRAASPMRVDDGVARLKVDETLVTWTRHRFRIDQYRSLSNTLTIPLRIEGLPEGWSVELDGWSEMRIISGGEVFRDAVISKPVRLLGIGLDRSIELPIGADFADRHAQQPLDVSIAAELSLYGPAQQIFMAVEGAAMIPGLGRCESQAADYLAIVCQSVFGVRSRVIGQWGTQTPTLVVLTQEASRSPFPLVPAMHPISISRGGFGAQSGYSKGRISISLRKPMAYVQRRIELRGIKLAEILR